MIDQCCVSKSLKVDNIYMNYYTYNFKGGLIKDLLKTKI